MVLDLLTDGKASKAGRGHTKNSERYRMWSPAYTALSILIQLQGIFTVEGLFLGENYFAKKLIH